MKYFIPSIWYFKLNRRTNGTSHLELRDGQLALWNDNAMRYQVFNAAEKCINRDGWIGDASELDDYFKEICPKEYGETV